MSQNTTMTKEVTEEFYDSIESAKRSEIQKLQSQRLIDTVKRIYSKVPYYRHKMEAAGLRPEDISGIEDLHRLPFTVKEDLRINYPFGMFCVPQKEVVRLHASSGTTGKPTVVGYTQNDINIWSDMVARIVTMAGVTAEDTVQIAFGYGLFTGAFGLHYGLEKIGATVIPISSGNTKKQIMLMQDFATTVLVSTPSYALHMGEIALEMGIDPKKDLNVRIGLFGGEGSSEAMRQQLHELWGMFATENYGMSELIGPGVSGECRELAGMHINEDHFIAEIVDPVTGEVLDDGEKGELVITAITKEALPLIRYRTKDLTRLFTDQCVCGRTMARMEKISGRNDDMLIVRGVNVFPTQIEEVLGLFDDLGPHYEIILAKKGYLDIMEIKVELKEALAMDSYHYLESLERKIASQLKSSLGISAKISLVSPRTLQRFEGKAKRITDLREKDKE